MKKILLSLMIVCIFMCGCVGSKEEKIEKIEDEIETIQKDLLSCYGENESKKIEIIEILYNATDWAIESGPKLADIKYSQAYSDSELDEIQNTLNNNRDKTLGFLEKYNDSKANEVIKNMFKDYEIFSTICKGVRDTWTLLPGSDDFLQGPRKDEFLPIQSVSEVNDYAEELKSDVSESLNKTCEDKFGKSYDEYEAEKKDLEAQLEELKESK